MAQGVPDSTRYIHIYCDSREEKEFFDKIADDHSATTSRYFLNVIREAVADAGAPKPAKQSEDIQALRDHIADLDEALRSEKRRADDLEAEKRRLLAEPWLSQTPLSNAVLDPDLIRILKAGQIRDYQLVEAMGIDRQDVRSVRALTRQLEALEGMGLVRKEKKGWRWMG